MWLQATVRWDCGTGIPSESKFLVEFGEVDKIAPRLRDGMVHYKQDGIEGFIPLEKIFQIRGIQR